MKTAGLVILKMFDLSSKRHLQLDVSGLLDVNRNNHTEAIEINNEAIGNKKEWPSKSHDTLNLTSI